MNGLTIIRPITITPAMLVSTDVPEADYAAYSAATTYALAARVIYDHGIYESLANSNTANTPSTSPAKWVFVSATNRFKLFDLVNSSQTAQSTTMTYTVRPGTVVTAVGAVNLTSVFTIRIRVVSDAYGVVYDETITRTRTPPASGWWNWYYGRRTEALASYYTDLPSFADAQIIIDFTGLADMAVGTLILGQVSRWAIGPMPGTSRTFNDYSQIQENQWGDVAIVPGKVAKRIGFRFILEEQEEDTFPDFIESIGSQPCLWIGKKRNRDIVVFGFKTEFETNYDLGIADCSLTIKGFV